MVRNVILAEDYFNQFYDNDNNKYWGWTYFDNEIEKIILKDAKLGLGEHTFTQNDLFSILQKFGIEDSAETEGRHFNIEQIISHLKIWAHYTFVGLQQVKIYENKEFVPNNNDYPALLNHNQPKYNYFITVCWC